MVHPHSSLADLGQPEFTIDLTMIQKQYVKAVRAIVEAIFAEQGEADLSEHLESVLDFVIDQFHRMPDYLRPPMMALTVALDCWPYFQGWSRQFIACR